MSGQRVRFKVIWLLYVFCALSALSGFFIHGHPLFELEEIPAVFSLIGLFSTGIVYLLSKHVLHRTAHRDEDFYND